MVHAASREFDRQRDRLVSLGYPALAGLSSGEFTEAVEPLRMLVASSDHVPLTTSDVPWVIVVTPGLIDPELLVPLLRLDGGTLPGVVDRNHGDDGLSPYAALSELNVPEGGAYLLFGIERGEEFCNVRPEDALPVIKGRGRTPLTIPEGIALVTHFPELLEKNKCFMLSGSRRGDRRVPAMWISAKAPKLGWCWDGNSHTWLGTASAGGRAGLAAG